MRVGQQYITWEGQDTMVEKVSITNKLIYAIVFVYMFCIMYYFILFELYIHIFVYSSSKNMRNLSLTRHALLLFHFKAEK